MQENTLFENPLSMYLTKQKKFKTLVKSVQNSLKSKEYKQQGYSFDEYIKNQWNISKAQAYRYLISAKVIDQLEEFDIQPSYERLCRSLYNYAKTPQQMKLLWGTILKRARSRPDCINSSHVTKIWKELYMDEKYSHICNYEKSIMDKVERSLNRYSKNIKLKQMNSYGMATTPDYGHTTTTTTYFNTPNSNASSPALHGSNSQYSPLMKENQLHIITLNNNLNHHGSIITNYTTPPPLSSTSTSTTYPETFNESSSSSSQYFNSHTNAQVSNIPSPIIAVPVDQYGNKITFGNTINTPLSPVSNYSPVSYDENNKLNSVTTNYTPSNFQTATATTTATTTTTIIYQDQNTTTTTSIPPQIPPQVQPLTQPQNQYSYSSLPPPTTQSSNSYSYQQQQPTNSSVQIQYNVPQGQATANNETILSMNPLNYSTSSSNVNTIPYQPPPPPPSQPSINYSYSQPQQTIVNYQSPSPPQVIQHIAQVPQQVPSQAIPQVIPSQQIPPQQSITQQPIPQVIPSQQIPPQQSITQQPIPQAMPQPIPSQQILPQQSMPQQIQQQQQQSIPQQASQQTIVYY
ncbi:hypothetical protein BCR36DRAFT_369679 [Piromyces finnis]|uniref:Uncharacterized protein n=1 Tax=Piromyces finnis TaxID=1754191 RepID=A0A1Y1VBY1_9FUNG|nr:hypothetical protein BCR36DRAFT_369679 [Piromyces finnis]|eukprot:ORX51766.1 hypothetical protein BCR36DRAFT_369679 [Piromyces finnis]